LKVALDANPEMLNIIALTMLTLDPIVAMITAITTILDQPNTVFLLLPLSVDGLLPLPPPPSSCLPPGYRSDGGQQADYLCDMSAGH